MEAQVTFAADRHTKGTMNEHFEADQPARRPRDILLPDFIGYFMNPPQVHFPGHDHHIGKPGIKLHRLKIGDVDLSRNMHLHSDRPGIQNDRDIDIMNYRSVTR